MSDDEETIVSKEHGEILNAMTPKQKTALHAWTLAFAEHVAGCKIDSEAVEDEYEEWCHGD